ncbi:hypothetical protein [Bradyrhizobium liaoningense]|uniref:hypothetical protein n=1 Tax=Bradyrhizobium liaoningense TaxID=43992 RepID=UPI001BA51C4B|nr:hypothetical protein [Bradyrhizobium liaoningense]MBR0718595.1 hypothetical protein [Bradyrhizobium liaoningense]
MADIMSILSKSYRSSALSSAPGSGKYTAVDPAKYQGTWSGKYANGKSFTLSITNVSGFRAQIKYQSEGTSQYQQVLIKDSSFRFGDTKFTLSKDGQAVIKNVVTDPATGSTYLDTAYATQDS